jgi:hypothetical protein
MPQLPTGSPQIVRPFFAGERSHIYSHKAKTEGYCAALNLCLIPLQTSVFHCKKKAVASKLWRVIFCGRFYSYLETDINCLRCGAKHEIRNKEILFIIIVLFLVISYYSCMSEENNEIELSFETFLCGKISDLGKLHDRNDAQVAYPTLIAVIQILQSCLPFVLRLNRDHHVYVVFCEILRDIRNIFVLQDFLEFILERAIVAKFMQKIRCH